MGEFQHALDEKGRLTLPAKFREGLGTPFVITRGLDKCLFAYPQSEWGKLESKLQGLPLARADARAFVRFLFSGATESIPDKQGRVLLPAPLREYAEMERDVVVVGVSNRVELWSLPRWQAYTAEAAASFADIAEKLVDLPL